MSLPILQIVEDIVLGEGLVDITRWCLQGIQILVSTYVLGQYQIWGRGVFQGNQNSKTSKFQDLPKFELSGGGEGVFWDSQIPKWQVLAKFSLLGWEGGGGGGLFWTKSQKRVNWDF